MGRQQGGEQGLRLAQIFDTPANSPIHGAFFSMRISGGQARGIPIRVPKGLDIRPAMDRLRQGVFSSLGPRVENCRFLDLFAGSGSYGLEAFSRGAAGGIFVERSRPALEALRINLEAVCRSAGRSPGEVQVVCGDAVGWTLPPGFAADLIFCDPPYEAIQPQAEALFARFAAALAPDGLVLFEMPGEIELNPPGWSLLKSLGGKSGRQPACRFYRREAEA
jgi:16S rRNA (guanine966-N2)-methyltransferase